MSVTDDDLDASSSAKIEFEKVHPLNFETKSKE